MPVGTAARGVGTEQCALLAWFRLEVLIERYLRIALPRQHAGISSPAGLQRRVIERIDDSAFQPVRQGTYISGVKIRIAGSRQESSRYTSPGLFGKARAKSFALTLVLLKPAGDCRTRSSPDHKRFSVRVRAKTGQFINGVDRARIISSHRASSRTSASISLRSAVRA